MILARKAMATAPADITPPAVRKQLYSLELGKAAHLAVCLPVVQRNGCQVVKRRVEIVCHLRADVQRVAVKEYACQPQKRAQVLLWRLQRIAQVLTRSKRMEKKKKVVKECSEKRVMACTSCNADISSNIFPKR